MKKSILSSLVVISLLFISCDLTKLNENVKAPTNIPGDPLFTNAQTLTGIFLQQVNVNINIFNLISQHWTTTTYTAEPRYNLTRRTIPSNQWTVFYNVLNDLQRASILVEANENLSAAVKQNQQACIEVMQALAYSKLVDTFGDIVYTQALDPEITLPKYDDAQTIYMSLLDSLNTAIANFNPSASGFGSVADIYYNGDIGQWSKFANSLKLRLGMMLADVDNATAQAAVESAVAAGVFTSNADNAMMHFVSAPPNTNPVWTNLVQSGRDDFVPGEPLVNRMNEWNDPRRAVFFIKNGADYEGGIYGVTNDYSAYSHFSDLVTQNDRPGMILGYDEVEFLLAEAVERGYNVPGTAAGHYEKAITADMTYWGISQTDITAYLSQPTIAYGTAPGSWREKIGRQKWAALFLQGLQAWTAYRRLDAPALQPPDVTAVNIDIVPVRYTYPLTEQRFNTENYETAGEAIGGDKLTTRIFWDVQ